METITELTKIDFPSVFISVFMILFGIKAIVSLFEWFVKKLGLETKGMRKRREEHDLLLQTTENLSELQKRQKEDVEQSIAHDKKIQNELSEFMNEIKQSLSQTQLEIKQFTENRIHDREQSFKIQKDLTDAIKTVTDGEKDRDIQIEALICGNKELLGAEIDKRYREYVALKGIPETDVDEFDDIFTAYKKLHGNHRRDMKYNYVKDHLSVIPVKTKLVLEGEDKK